MAAGMRRPRGLICVRVIGQKNRIQFAYQGHRGAIRPARRVRRQPGNRQVRFAGKAQGGKGVFHLFGGFVFRKGGFRLVQYLVAQIDERGFVFFDGIADALFQCRWIMHGVCSSGGGCATFTFFTK